MTRIEWTAPAIADLENIHDYIARDSTEYADALVERLILSGDQLESFPESGRPVPESTDLKVRELLIEGYRVIYRLKIRECPNSCCCSWRPTSCWDETQTMGEALVF